MYKATLINKELRDNELVVTIEYSNGTNSFQEVTTTNGGFASVEQLKNQVKAKVDLLNAKEDIEKELVVGDIELPVEVVAEKTPEELAFDLFISDYHKLQKVNDLISAGVLTGEEKPVVDLKAKVRSEFEPNYIDLI